jgi:hypothetical protein
LEILQVPLQPLGLGLQNSAPLLLAAQLRLGAFAGLDFGFHLLLGAVEDLLVAELGLADLLSHLQRTRIHFGLPRPTTVIGRIEGRHSRQQRFSKVRPGMRLQTHLNQPPNPVGGPNCSQEPRDPGQGQGNLGQGRQDLIQQAHHQREDKDPAPRGSGT